MKINFNSPLITGNESEYISGLLSFSEARHCGDGGLCNKSKEFLQDTFSVKKVLLTPSCTSALEMAAMLLDIKEGDEVIMPSFTFVSTANPFVLRGATCVFVDIKPEDLNIDEHLIEAAITSKTRAIVVVHYAGAACNMKEIKRIAEEHKLFVIEDAAQCINAKYEDTYLGTIGDLGAISFHETKNIHCGEGGALFINNPAFFERAEIIREKGTNRSKFIKGLVDKYTWVDFGSSYLMNELSAGFLYAQLKAVNEVTAKRLSVWNYYYSGLLPLEDRELLELPRYNASQQHNGHLFYIKTKNAEIKSGLFEYLKNEKQITAPFHYIALHSSSAGRQFGRFSGQDRYTTPESERLLRLPLYYSITEDETAYVVQCISDFFKVG